MMGWTFTQLICKPRRQNLVDGCLMRWLTLVQNISVLLGGERHSSVFVDVLQKRWRPGHIGSCRLFSYVNISLLWGESDGGIPGTAYRSPSRILAHFPTSAKPSMLWTIIISLIGRKVRFQAYFVRNAKSEVPKYNFCLESAVRNWDLLRSNADTRRHA